MKKTLITISLAVAFTGLTSAATLQDAVLQIPQYDGTQATSTPITGEFSTLLNGARPQFTMTVVLDWNTLQSMATDSIQNIAYLSDGGVNTTGVGIKLTEGTPTIYTTYNGAARGTYSVNCDLAAAAAGHDGELAITLTMLGTNSGGVLYVLDEQDRESTHWTDSGLKMGNTTAYDQFSINSSIAEAVDSVYVWNETLSASDIISTSKLAISNMAPEPATASLTLLGLAALAMRRRRA